LKLLLDEMLDPRIAVQLRARGHRVRDVQEESVLRGESDRTLLRLAELSYEALVTDNVADFCRLHDEFMVHRNDHAGIILASPARFPRSKRTVGLWVDALDRLLVEFGANGRRSLRNECHWLQ